VDGRLQPQLERSVESLAGATDHREDRRGRAYLALPVRRSGSQVATVVAAGTTTHTGAPSSSVWLSILLGLATVGIATAAAWVAATRSLRPVQAMADLADDWREHDIERRFDPGEGGDEIAHLGRTLDQMLDRIVDSLSAERRLTDEIAHELRTPLAVVLAEADLARQDATGAQREGLDNIHGAAVGCATPSTPCCPWLAAAPRGGADDGRQEYARSACRRRRTTVGAGRACPPLVAAVRPLLETPSVTAPADLTSTWRDGRTVVISVLDDGRA
jgi:signal transduction histidine kinase